MSDEPKCPHCMAPVSVTDTAGNPWFACGTTKTFRSASCIDREPLAIELRAAKERIKRLEDAGSIVALRLSFWRDSNQNWLCEGDAAAWKEWKEAKEAKP